ncbi:3-oxoacyl-[acyl-carrier-protein] synthase III C-terminal domain-containing protein [Myroides odoratimimus]|uniref:3-oxoacyl-[acyl-carrier-protein] synthase III C-terminal domain-containing protein n=1 Tax=Myroides odoratimimus TaxID=76832 RepID=UPI003100F9E8
MKLVHTYFYHPSNIESNEDVIKQFEEQGVSMGKIQEALGRTNRFIVPKNSDETTVSMGIEAAKGVLKQSGISIGEIDIIAFVTCTPEHQIPCDSIFIHNGLKAKHNTMCYDINVNCIGAFVALDQVTHYLNSSKTASKALVVCSEKLSNILDTKNPVTAFCFSDSAFAFIVEKDTTPSGLVDVLYHTDSSFCDTVLFPPKGHSCFMPGELTMWDTSFDGSGSVEFALDKIESFLAKNGLTIEDISLFLLSQLSLKNIKKIKEYYNLPDKKVPFYSKELGYSGSSSPFLALHQYQKEVKPLKQGDYFLMWTLGAGYQAGLMLWRY